MAGPGLHREDIDTDNVDKERPPSNLRVAPPPKVLSKEGRRMDIEMNLGLLRDSGTSHYPRLNAIRYFVAFPEMEEAVGPLLDLLAGADGGREDCTLCAAAAEALGVMGYSKDDEGRSVAEGLLGGLCSHSESVRGRSAEALGKMGKASAAMPLLNALEAEFGRQMEKEGYNRGLWCFRKMVSALERLLAGCNSLEELDDFSSIGERWGSMMQNSDDSRLAVDALSAMTSLKAAVHEKRKNQMVLLGILLPNRLPASNGEKRKDGQSPGTAIRRR